MHRCVRRISRPLYQPIRRSMHDTSRPLRVLGIETSCDDTGVSVVQRHPDGRGEVLADFLSSQFDVHESFGGVVPHLAQRSHAANLPVGIEEITRQMQSRGGLASVDAVAVTAGPGLALCLQVGFDTAESLAATLGKPLVKIHHMEAHALMARLEEPSIAFPFLSVLVSGGHTLVARVDGVSRVTVLGSTLDDSLGEAFDKVGRLLRVANHSDASRVHVGAMLEHLAAEGDPDTIRLSVPLRKARGGGSPAGVPRGTRELPHPCRFSFAGIKSAIARRMSAEPIEDRAGVANVAASFQKTVALHLQDQISAALDYCKQTEKEGHLQLEYVVLSGGVAANDAIRRAVRHVAEAQGLPLAVPRPSLCTDNGIMVAWAGLERMAASLPYDPRPEADFSPRWPLGTEQPVWRGGRSHRARKRVS